MTPQNYYSGNGVNCNGDNGVNAWPGKTITVTAELTSDRKNTTMVTDVLIDRAKLIASSKNWNIKFMITTSITVGNGVSHSCGQDYNGGNGVNHWGRKNNTSNYNGGNVVERGFKSDGKKAYRSVNGYVIAGVCV